jgi:hypothetical protein
MHSALLLLLAVAGVTACDRHGSPTSPTPTVPQPTGSIAEPANGEPISGTVSDSALRRLAGATVEILNGPQAGLSTTTDASGHFSLFASADDATRFRASKDGYVAAEASILPNCDRCNPRRWVHFYLSVLEPAVALAGDYTLTFIADSACANLPEAVRTRSYEATIALGDFSWVGFPAHADTSFKVTPKGSDFPAGLNDFWLNAAGNFIAVVLGDHTDPGVTERVAPDTYLAFNGSATVSVGSPVSTISTPFDGWIDLCVNPTMGNRYDCTPGRAITRTRCYSARHQLVLTRHSGSASRTSASDDKLTISVLEGSVSRVSVTAQYNPGKLGVDKVSECT